MKNLKIKITVLFSLAIAFCYGQNFSDDLTSESIGDFPSNWNLLNGTAQLELVEGSKALVLGDDAIVALKSANSDYLNNEFTIEFNLYFDKVLKSVGYQNYKLRLWPGTSAGKENTDRGMKSFRAITIKRHGSTTSIVGGGEPKKEFSNYLSDLRDHEPVWRKIKITYSDNLLSLLIDGNSILTIPGYTIDASQISIEANGQNELIKAFNALKIDGFINSEKPEIDTSTSSTGSEHPQGAEQDDNSIPVENDVADKSPTTSDPTSDSQVPSEENLPDPEEIPSEEIPSENPVETENLPEDTTTDQESIGEIIELEPTEETIEEPQPEQNIPEEELPETPENIPSAPEQEVEELSEWEKVKKFIIEEADNGVQIYFPGQYSIFCDYPSFLI